MFFMLIQGYGGELLEQTSVWETASESSGESILWQNQLGSESFCQAGLPFVPVISRNKEDKDADIYEMDRQESEEIQRSRSSSVTRNDEKGSEGRETKKGSEKRAKDTKPEDFNKADTSNSLVQVLTS